MISRPFRFDEADHVYRDEHGRPIPSITQLLALSGWVEQWYYTEAARERGSAVHLLTQQLDLGEITVDDVTLEPVDDGRISAGVLKGYLLAHQESMRRLQAELEHVEVAAVHPEHRFAGRCDRVGKFFGLRGVLDVKTGMKHKSHKIQTAMQAILAEPTLKVPPTKQIRLTTYIKADGKFSVEQWSDPDDVVEAYRIIRRYCSPTGDAAIAMEGPTWMHV